MNTQAQTAGKTAKTYEEVRSRNYQALCDYINEKNILRDNLEDFLKEDEFDEDTDAYDITQAVDDRGAFDVEIIYYSRAIEYLSKNDPSLQESMEMAYEMGYDCKSLNSEILASIHASETARNEWAEAEDDINTFLATLDWDVEDEDENEEEE